jgi:hypothetical protein
MALDLKDIQDAVALATGILDKAKDAAPAVLDAAKGLVSAASNLVTTAKANLDEILHPTMTAEETVAALDQARKDLDVSLEAVRTAPTPPHADVSEPLP